MNPTIKELPPKFSTITESECFHGFTFLMRLKLLAGYRIRIQHQLLSVNRPGKSKANFKITLSKSLTWKDHVKESVCQ